jgi:hypothetical protein
MRAHPSCGLKLFGYTAQATCDEVENSEVMRTMPVALGQAELRGSLRDFCFVGRVGKSAVDAKIIQEGQRREVLSDALMQLRERTRKSTSERTSDHSYVASRGTRQMTANPSVRRLSLTQPGFRRPSALRSNMTRRRPSPRRTRRSWACLASFSRATTTSHLVTGRRRARCPAGGIAVLGTLGRLTLTRWITADTAA